jgi:hypothetical protein
MGRAAKRFRARVLIAPARFQLIHKSDHPTSGESFIKPKENDDVGAELISLLHSFLDFSYILLRAVESHKRSPFSW